MRSLFHYTAGVAASMNMYDFVYEVGLCRLNQVDPYPITYSLSNP
jgi:hypothetical protein